MLERLKAKAVLEYLIELLTAYLENLQDVEDVPLQQFLYGEKTAYIECLEIVKYWEQAEKFGLDYDVEKKFRYK